MMQQVAAKSSDIAALPIEVDVNTSTPSGDTEGSVFADLLQQSKQAVNTSPEQKESNISEQEKASETIDEPSTSVKSSEKASVDPDTSVDPDASVDTEGETTSSQSTDDARTSGSNRDQTESSNGSRTPVKPTPLSGDSQPEEDIPNLHDGDLISEVTRIEEHSRYFTTVPDISPDYTRQSDDVEIESGVSSVADDVLSLIEYVEKIQSNLGSEIQTHGANVTERLASILGRDVASTPNSSETPEVVSNVDADENAEVLNTLTKKLSEILETEPADVTAISEALLRYKQTPSPDLPRVEEVGIDDPNRLAEAVRASLDSADTEPTVSVDANGIASTDNASQNQTEVLTEIVGLINRAISPDTNENAGEINVLDNESEASQLAIDVELVKQVLNQENPRYVSQPDVPTVVASSTSTTSNNAVQSEETQLHNSVELALGLQSEPVQDASIQRIAEAVVTSVPSPTPQLQEQVKGALNNAVAEITKQIEQGHEPAINLEDVIAQTLTENGVTVTPQLTAHIEQHINQTSGFLNIAQHIADARYALDAGSSTDVSVGETTRLQVETQHSQQQTQQIDKAVNFHTPEGKQQINEKIRWMVNARQSMAEIRLDPPELGSMQVRVNVSGDAASVSFVVQSQVARDAIADAMPKLREMLSEQGIDLGEAFVQQQDRQNQHDAQEQGFASGQHEGFDFDDEESTVIEQRVTRDMKGGVDAYA